ncbi:MAG: hypothetical protein SVM79_08130 [Chloroflexota bacterium]|nr:hypothetical protein [Chloroflexota bacterium]
MEDEMLIISKTQVEVLRNRLADPGGLESGLREVRRMIEIKSTLLWRADLASCCVGPQWAARLDAEVQILENTINELETGNIDTAISLLGEYQQIIGYETLLAEEEVGCDNL